MRSDLQLPVQVLSTRRNHAAIYRFLAIFHVVTFHQQSHLSIRQTRQCNPSPPINPTPFPLQFSTYYFPFPSIRNLVGTGFSQESTTPILDKLIISAFDTPAVSTDAPLFSYLPTFIFSTTIYTKAFGIATFPYVVT